MMKDERRRGCKGARQQSRSWDTYSIMEREAGVNANTLHHWELVGTTVPYKQMTAPRDGYFKASEPENRKEIHLVPATISPIGCSNVPASR